MNFLSRSEINATYAWYLKPYAQSGDLPYLTAIDHTRLLSLEEVALLLGFDSADLASFIITHPELIPFQRSENDIFFEREAVLSWYLKTALPLLKEASC